MSKSMQQAVQDAIKFFTDNKREFSAHDGKKPQIYIRE